jgi:hypothetical protein
MVVETALPLFLWNQHGTSSRVIICEKIAQFLGSGNLVDDAINLLLFGLVSVDLMS